MNRMVIKGNGLSIMTKLMTPNASEKMLYIGPKTKNDRIYVLEQHESIPDYCINKQR